MLFTGLRSLKQVWCSTVDVYTRSDIEVHKLVSCKKKQKKNNKKQIIIIIIIIIMKNKSINLQYKSTNPSFLCLFISLIIYFAYLFDFIVLLIFFLIEHSQNRKIRNLRIRFVLVIA